jgi:hypothetical protein
MVEFLLSQLPKAELGTRQPRLNPKLRKSKSIEPYTPKALYK